MALFPVLNANYFSWSSVEIRLFTPFPFTFAGVKSLNYSDNLSRKLVHGTVAVPIGVTKGKYEAKGEIELWLPQANLMITSMGLGWRQIPITIVASYISDGPFGLPAAGLPQPVITDTISGCYLTGLDAAQAESDDPLSRKFGLTISNQILWNGLPSLIEPLLAIATA